MNKDKATGQGADMTKGNEQIIRNAYHLAEIKDVPGFTASFTEDGTFTDESIGVVYRGPKELGRPVEIYAKAFHDMHRELYKFYVAGDIVVVQLALQGTHRAAGNAIRNNSRYRQENGRALLRRIPVERREDPAL
jgi:ketosteroid isomerase-like protein